MKTLAAVAFFTISQLLTHQSHAAGAPIIGSSKLYISSSGPTSAAGYTYMSANDLPTTVYFQWGLTTNYGNSTTGQVINGGYQFVNVPPITGLEQATLYHARVFAMNASGVAYSTDEAFTTPPVSTAETLQPTNINATGVTLRGRAYPSGVSPATAYFQYFLDYPPYTSLYTPTQTLVSASNRTLVTATLSNLDTASRYWHRLVVNTGSDGFGAGVTFFTGAGTPIVQTDPPTGITAYTATLGATVNPNGLATVVAFQWGLTTNYGNITNAQSFSTGTSSVPATASIGQLTANTTYHVRAVATNGMGVGFGNDVAFTTISTNPPAATTLAPSNITTNAATLHGSVQTYNVPTTAYFQWGTTTNYGSNTAAQALPASGTPTPVQANLASLLTDTIYHCRLVASNAVGIGYGADVLVTPTSLLYLYAGESWSYVFHDLPLLGELPTQNPGFSICDLGFVPGSFSPGGAIQIELFLNSTNSPGALGVLTPGQFPRITSFAPLWLNDLEGGVRLTMLTGSVVVSSVLIEQIGQHHGAGSLAPDYRNTITTTKSSQPPLFGTQFLSSVTISSAVVTLDINARNLNSGVFVEWGSTTNYGVFTGHLLLNHDYFVRRSITVSNLSPSIPYHFRVVATNSAGTTYGYDLPLASGVIPPRFIRSAQAPGGQVWLQATGSAGLNYTLEKNTAWSNWTGVTNLIFSPAGSINVTQDTSGVLPGVYRFRWP